MLLFIYKNSLQRAWIWQACHTSSSRALRRRGSGAAHAHTSPLARSPSSHAHDPPTLASP